MNKEEVNIRSEIKLSGRKDSKTCCPMCEVLEVRVLDRENDVYSCINGHFWKTFEGVSLPLRRLSVSEVSVKLNSLSNQYMDELAQIQKLGVLDGVDFGLLGDLRAAQLKMVEDGELLIFLRPDNSILYVLTCLIP